MLGRIVEVSSDQRHLSMHRGFLIVRNSCSGSRNEEIGRVPLDDIAALITNAHGLSYTNNLLVALAERGIPMVLCASNHNVVGLLWPIDGHHQQAHRMDAQISCGAPSAIVKEYVRFFMRRLLTFQCSPVARLMG